MAGILNLYFTGLQTTSGPSVTIIENVDSQGYFAKKIRIQPGQSLYYYGWTDPIFNYPYTITNMTVKLNGTIINTLNVTGINGTLATSLIPGGLYYLEVSLTGSEDSSGANGGPFPFELSQTSYTLIILVGDSPDLHTVQNRVITHPMLSDFTEDTGAINLNDYKGWTAPTAASMALSFVALQEPTRFPLYVTSLNSNISDFYSFGYPAWRQFQFDAGRPGASATITSSDCTDFGWWMNTSNTGDDSLNGTGSYKGTTLENLYIGLDNFFSHVGYANAIFAINKINSTTLGTATPAYTSSALNTSSNYLDFLKSTLIISNTMILVTLKSKLNIYTGSNDYVNKDCFNPTFGGDGEIFNDIVMSELRSNTEYHQDFSGTDLLNITSDLSAIGNTYLVVGYINSTSNNLFVPTNARNKDLIVLKSIGNKNSSTQEYQNIFVSFDTKLVSSNVEELTFWNALLATHVIRTHRNYYVSPRIPLEISPAFGVSACTGIAKTIVPTLVNGGQPIDHRFTGINGGKAATIFGFSTGTIVSSPPYPLVYTWNTAGSYFYNKFNVSDGVSRSQIGLNVEVSNPIDATFGLIRPPMVTTLSGTDYSIPANTNYWFKEAGGYIEKIDDDDIRGGPRTSIIVTLDNGSSASGLYNMSHSDYGDIFTTNPPYYYLSLTPGIYRVTRYITNGHCTTSYTSRITAVSPSTYIDFSYDPITVVGSSIQFNDTSTESTSDWSWDFGDGIGSPVENPQHTYGSPGTYVVTMTALTQYGYLSASHTLTVFVGSASADFYYTPNINITAANTTQVQFFPIVSPSDPAFSPSYSWDFGDSTTSNLKFPSHSYVAPGTYTVTLVFSCVVGPNTLTDTRTHQIIVLPAGLTALSTTIMIPRNIGHTVDLRDLASYEPGFTYDLVPNIYDPNITHTQSDYIVTFQPDLNFVGIDSYRYKVKDPVFIREATGKITYIVKKPEIELLIGSTTSGFSVLNNPFGDFDVSYNTVDINTSVVKTFILKNIGEGNLHISDLLLIGTDISSYQLKNTSNVNISNITNVILKKDEVVSFKIEFHPTTIGKKKVRIKITHN